MASAVWRTHVHMRSSWRCLQNSHVRFIGRLDMVQQGQTGHGQRLHYHYHIYKTVCGIRIDVRGAFAFRLASLSCPLNATNLRRSAECRVELELILFVSLNSITMTITRLHDCARLCSICGSIVAVQEKGKASRFSRQFGTS